MELTQKQILRFWSKVDVKGNLDECWEWEGYFGNNYGQININKKEEYAHRISYELYYGKIPKHNSYHGMCVCHKCDNTKCVNPHHLFLGTNKDNMIDCKNKNRTTQGEKNAMHKLTEQEVLEIRSKYKWYVYTYKMLAEEYGVNYITILDIIKRKTWKHI